MRTFENLIIILSLLIFSITINSCKKNVTGCTDSDSPYFNLEANVDDGSCLSWSEEMTGNYSATMSCNLLSVINGDFQLAITNIDDKTVNVNMVLENIPSIVISGSVIGNNITFDPFLLDGLNLEFEYDFNGEKIPITIKSVEISGSLAYDFEHKSISGPMSIKVSTNFIPITDTCNIAGVKI